MASLALALVLGGALLVALGANAIAGTAHFGSHLIDREPGAHPTDPRTTGLFALFLVVLTLWRARQLGRVHD